MNTDQPTKVHVYLNFVQPLTESCSFFQIDGVAGILLIDSACVHCFQTIPDIDLILQFSFHSKKNYQLSSYLMPMQVIFTQNHTKTSSFRSLSSNKK